MTSCPKPKDRGSDMTRTLEEHRLTTKELLAKGEEALTQGKLLRASEKFWGAAAQAVKALSIPWAYAMDP